MPPRLPAPVLTSATVRMPGSQVAASGSLATSSKSSVTGRSAEMTRSMIRVPRMSSRPFGCPPNRVDRPPASTTPVTRSVTRSDSATTVVRGPERLILGQPYLGHGPPSAERLFHALEDEPRHVFTARHQPPLLELGHIAIDVLLVEPYEHDLVDNVVEVLEIDDEPRRVIDLAADGHVARVLMLVKVLLGAGTEHQAIVLVVPLRQPIAVQGRELHASREEGACHYRKAVRENPRVGAIFCRHAVNAAFAGTTGGPAVVPRKVP